VADHRGAPQARALPSADALLLTLRRPPAHGAADRDRRSSSSSSSRGHQGRTAATARVAAVDSAAGEQQQAWRVAAMESLLGSSGNHLPAPAVLADAKSVLAALTDDGDDDGAALCLSPPALRDVPSLVRMLQAAAVDACCRFEMPVQLESAVVPEGRRRHRRRPSAAAGQPLMLCGNLASSELAGRVVAAVHRLYEAHRAEVAAERAAAQLLSSVAQEAAAGGAAAVSPGGHSANRRVRTLSQVALSEVILTELPVPAEECLTRHRGGRRKRSA
jgi:hypothetical protein